MRFIIIALLYNAIFLSLLSSGIAAPAKIPPCDITKYIKDDSDAYFSMPIDAARSCLTSFPYEKVLGKSVIDTIEKALTAYYVFLDSARDPPAPGNTYDSIDVLGSLKKLLNQDFDTDYDFTHNVTNILGQLKDAHTGLHTGCYQNFIFLQGIDLYSVVESDGKQSIKVWKDFFDDTNIDCDVLQIDGVPALQAIKQFADENIGITRDLGVRFNMALTSVSTDGTSEFSNFFSRRLNLPPSDKITYTLQCSGTKKNVERTWTSCGKKAVMSGVTNNKTYWDQFCVQGPLKTKLPSYRKLPTEITMQERSTSSTSDTICGIIDSAPAKLANGQLLPTDTLATKFYLLPEQSTGVVAMDKVFDQDELIQGFQKFIDKGVKKVILDLTNNPGGYINAAQYLNKLLFPKTDPSFDTDFRVSELMRLSIQKSTSPSLLTFPGNWLNPQTKEPFKDANSFIGNNTYTRGGVSEDYTSHFIDVLQFLSKNNFPWKAADYAILTNGFCGSACSLIATHLAEENNVLTISVGGFANTPMAFASFTGGQVMSLTQMLEELDQLGIDSPLVPNPFKILAELTFAIREAYSRSKPNEILEFSYRPATKRLYYDNKSARDPSELWVQVAKILQGTQ